MARTCTSCGETFGFTVVAPGDLERTFDYAEPWQGLRLLCPGCGSLMRVSFRSVALAGGTLPGAPSALRVVAVVGDGPEIVPFPLGPPAAGG